MSLFGFIETDYCLSRDRSDRQWDKANINLRGLAVVYRGAPIPPLGRIESVIENMIA